MSGAPVSARGLLSLAKVAHQDKQYLKAIAGYRDTVARDANLFDAWYGLGFASESVLEYGDAAAAMRRALTLRPDAAWMRVNLGKVLFELGRVTEALREFQRAANEGDEETRLLAEKNIACVAPGDPAFTNQAVLAARRGWASGQDTNTDAPALSWRPGEKLRIGYYGSYFDARNWMKGCMGVINAHDRDRFEVNLIVDGPLPTAASGYREHDDDRIWEVTGVSNQELAGHIAAAKLDVLIDLNGYSHQNRMPLLALRPAPVLIAWMGMYGTTGFSAVDCVIGDAEAIPPEEEAYCVERVRRVRHTYLAFDMFYAVPDVTAAPCLDNGYVTFGSLNSAYKITAEVVGSWARILNGVDGARLLLRNRGLDQASNRKDLLRRFAENGIGPERLILEAGGDHFDFLRTYGRVDIALDVFPYNGGTTTAEAIWQGVPVLSFNGDRWAGRTSSTILKAAGLGEWIAADQAGFEALAIGLGRAPGSLTSRRATQRALIGASPLCDTTGLCRELEAIYLAEAAAKL